MWTFRAGPERAKVLNALGVDVAQLANNHVYDYGQEAMYDTFSALEAVGIPYVGAGRTLEEAMKPYYTEVDGKKIAIVAASRAEKYKMTPQATDTTPGILRCYDTELFVQTIKEARANADYVVAVVHWGTEHTTVLEEMNREAKALGATQSHFVNANGLPDDDHYTTIYDMYLIFQAAIQTQDFIDIIHTQSYDAAYQHASGNAVTQKWESTNRYLNGQIKEPEDITVVGGKTGTTNAAGYCLVLYSKNKKGDDIVSIVYKGKTRSDMYTLMNQILSTFAN